MIDRQCSVIELCETCSSRTIATNKYITAMTMAYIKRKRDKHLPRKNFFIKKLSTNDSEPIKEKRKHQLKLAWLSLLKAEMTVSKYRLTIVI